MRKEPAVQLFGGVNGCRGLPGVEYDHDFVVVVQPVTQIQIVDVNLFNLNILFDSHLPDAVGHVHEAFTLQKQRIVP